MAALPRYPRALSIHPEGEDQSSERVEIVHCPPCQAKIAVPEILSVDQVACPECG